MYDVHNCVVSKFIYAGLNQLRLVAKKTNFSSTFTPKQAISRRNAYQLTS